LPAAPPKSPTAAKKGADVDEKGRA
jgi:hypothetical protein